MQSFDVSTTIRHCTSINFTMTPTEDVMWVTFEMQNPYTKHNQTHTISVFLRTKGTGDDPKFPLVKVNELSTDYTNNIVGELTKQVIKLANKTEHDYKNSNLPLWPRQTLGRGHTCPTPTSCRRTATLRR